MAPQGQAHSLGGPPSSCHQKVILDPVFTIPEHTLLERLAVHLLDQQAPATEPTLFLVSAAPGVPW